jgi:hemerythrin superfamily protein
MAITLNDSKRTAIACKLADIKEVQNLLIANEQRLMADCPDQDIRDELGKMIEDDRRNLGILDTVIVQYGIPGQVTETVTAMVEEIQELFMEGSQLSLYEKTAQHESLKHQQFMSGYLVHKAAQVVGADVEASIVPLNTVNFDNRAHEEKLKGVLEVLGVRELTGQEAKQGLWARVQDSIAALSGVAGSAVTHASNKSEMNIQDLLRLDHNKVNMLFAQIADSNDPQKIEEYFAQIYKDLSVHSEAEEQIVYPAVQGFYNETQELYNEQAEMKIMLEALKSSNATENDFKERVDRLKDTLMNHIRQEESTMFEVIRKNLSTEQQERMATEFKTAKSKLQEQIAVQA